MVASRAKKTAALAEPKTTTPLDGPVRLGYRVKDVVTGLVGIVNMRSINLNGNVQFAIQPPSEDTIKVADGQFVDEHILDILDYGVADRVPGYNPKGDSIILGAEYEDIVSLSRGIAIEKMDHLNGCVYVSLQPQKTDKKKTAEKRPDTLYLDFNRLKQVGKGVSKSDVAKVGQEVAKAPELPKEARAPGGPTRSAAAFRPR